MLLLFFKISISVFSRLLEISRCGSIIKQEKKKVCFSLYHLSFKESFRSEIRQLRLFELSLISFCNIKITEEETVFYAASGINNKVTFFFY